MSRGDGGIVAKECLVTKPSEKKSSAWPLDGPVGVSAEKILSDDPYRAYQEVFW